jgi:hypothetical protein
MGLEQGFLLLLGAGMAALGWFSREMYGAVQKLKEDLAKLEIKIGTDFVRYDRLREMLEPIGKSLDEIKETLREKADKP